jgi:antibiotic biosynthesis monooxygenase (ABM) superfamily enzyme
MNMFSMAVLGCISPWYVFVSLLVASIIIQIALANHWNVPWVIAPLERWLRLIERRFERQTAQVSEDEEPE